MKKRILTVLAVLLCAASVCSCTEKQTQTEGENTSSVYTSEGDATTAVTPDVSGAAAETEEDIYFQEGSDIDVNYTDVELLMAHCDKFGVSVKEIEGKVGGELVAKLSELAPTGEKDEKISDEPFSFQHSDKCYAPLGTFWIKTENGIYRILPEKTVSKVQDYYLEGDVLDADEDLFSFINDVWKYYPRNTLCCVYKDGEMSTRRVFDGESSVEMDLVSVSLSENASATNMANEITLTIVSNVDKTVTVEAVPLCEDGGFGKCEPQDVELKAGVKKEITLRFGGWTDKAYEVNVLADDSRVYVQIEK